MMRRVVGEESLVRRACDKVEPHMAESSFVPESSEAAR
jgi:hypothetical protein